MGLMFVPVLVETVCWEPVSWDYLREILDWRLKRLAEMGKVDEIYERISDRLADYLGKNVDAEKVKEKIADFIDDYMNASGIVSARSKVYRAVIQAIIDEFSEE